MKHDFERQPHPTIPGRRWSVCVACGRGWGPDLTTDALESMYEQCSGKPGIHQWGPAPGEKSFMEPPVCAVCGLNQNAVHPHSRCPGKPTAAADDRIAVDDSALQGISNAEPPREISDAELDTVPFERLADAVVRAGRRRAGND